ncbi:MAG: DUF1993 family protein [Alphaproteobacteria bacterium]
MAVTLSSATVPVFNQMLGGLSNVLDKAAAFCAAKNVQPETLLQMRLAPDMFTLTQQVNQATVHAVGAVARPAGIEPPALPEEPGLDGLKKRIAAALDFINGVPANKIDGQEGRALEIKTRVRTFNFTAQNYALQFAMPHFYFHVTTAYDILRHAGVELGKMDFMGKVPAS